MQDPRHYVEEIRANLAKLQQQGQVTAIENALFGMIDGLAGLQLVTLERVTRLEQQLSDLRATPTVIPPQVPAPSIAPVAGPH